MLPIGWHRLRHTFASHLATRGVSLQAIQELLGHANLKMTMRYAHLMPQVKRDAVLLLDSPPRTNVERDVPRHSKSARNPASRVRKSERSPATATTSDPRDRHDAPLVP